MDTFQFIDLKLDKGGMITSFDQLVEAGELAIDQLQQKYKSTPYHLSISKPTVRQSESYVYYAKVCATYKLGSLQARVETFMLRATRWDVEEADDDT